MEDRIVVKRNKKYKVNKQLAEEIETTGTKDSSTNVLADDRFKNLFTNKNFEIDYSSDMYKPVYKYKLYLLY